LGKHSRQRSSIDIELPEDVRKELRRLLVEGETYGSVTEWLNSQGFDISRSAVGRYGKTFFDVVKNVRMIEEQSSTLVGDADSSMVLEEATTKLILGKLLELLKDNKVDLDKSTKIMTDLANLQKASVSREKLKIEIRDRTQTAADKIETISKKAGLTAEIIATIRKEVLGIGK